jgi:hypothetical protein
LPGIDEEKLIRIRQCGTCRLRYAVFGEQGHDDCVRPLAWTLLSGTTCRHFMAVPQR